MTEQKLTFSANGLQLINIRPSIYFFLGKHHRTTLCKISTTIFELETEDIFEKSA